MKIFGALGRLWALRGTDAASLRGRDTAIAILAIVAAGEFALIDRFAPSSAAQFFPDGFLMLGCCVLVGLFGAWLLSRCSRPAVSYADALLLIVGLCPIAIAADAIINYRMPESWNLVGYVALAVYALCYFRRGLMALSGAPQSTAVLALVLLIGGFGWASNELGWTASLWTAPASADDSGSSETEERGEELLFDQPERIDAALAELAPAEGRDAQLYFLGFAGVGEEKVFADEIKLAARRIDERYGAARRTISLINDQRDLDSAPLATVSGLRRALKGIGAKMDRERDVLFLALSSHGSLAPDLAVSNGALPLLQLAPDELRGALDAAGIRWRVIVISACYAGAFIDALRDDHTIVIAAAAADRTSFGCSNDRHLTYFGEAFYRDALPKANSLRSAFDEAKRAIEARERAEKIEPSHPSAFFGAAMEAKLALLRR